MRDMATGRARGFAFVEMATEDDAQSAISALNNHDYNGRDLTVNEARPKTAGGGGGQLRRRRRRRVGNRKLVTKPRSGRRFEGRTRMWYRPF